MKQRSQTKNLSKISEIDPQCEYFRSDKDTYTFYCPIDGKWWDGSEYLLTVFKDARKLWLANMVTHYRHEHINWWNNRWCSGGMMNRWYYRQCVNSDYDTEKIKVNNQAKRQIIRKCTQFLVDHGFTVNDFSALQNTDVATLKLFNKKVVAA